MKEFVSKSIDDTRRFAKEWLFEVRKIDRKGALVVGLSGHLGAGKTAFVKEIAKELGVKGEVTSPTFVLMKMYGTGDSVFKNLVHIDAYRLSHGGEMKVLNLGQLISDPSNLIMIEWPENVGLKTDIHLEAQVDKSVVFKISAFASA